jgi:hypothetical protein
MSRCKRNSTSANQLNREMYMYDVKAVEFENGMHQQHTFGPVINPKTVFEPVKLPTDAAMKKVAEAQITDGAV